MWTQTDGADANLRAFNHLHSAPKNRELLLLGSDFNHGVFGSKNGVAEGYALGTIDS